MATWQYGELHVVFTTTEGTAEKIKASLKIKWSDGSGHTEDLDGVHHLVHLNALGREGWEVVGTYNTHWVEAAWSDPVPSTAWPPVQVPHYGYTSINFVLKRLAAA
ncbi:hypothetical protein [Streptomyces sp. NBC_00566]|uniref:hypothetical protein n=1 Tax=Streptomyces sp. NBC_00566 TaxID=2975778 RepID=UPI002E815234|nr:hypothetical protein [Streptomyces sp. NBC_00566]WUB90509.1 hypothetical protein OG812_29635 [Streptomyces sp. NBC_00566]